MQPGPFLIFSDEEPPSGLAGGAMHTPVMHTPHTPVMHTPVMHSPAAPSERLTSSSVESLPRPNPAPPRNHSCPNYETCLNIAASLNGESFHCAGCSAQVNQVLLWRAYQAQRTDVVAQKLCRLPDIRLRRLDGGRQVDETPQSVEFPASYGALATAAPAEHGVVARLSRR